MTQMTIPGLALRDISLPVPLDWANPEGETITLFAREVVDVQRKDEDLPLLAFLQGGPGGKSPRPANDGPSWLGVAVKTHRVILIDQRGTGRSSPIQGRHMARFSSGHEGGAFLAKFLAPSIVRDCEHLRKTIYGGRKWETLGQSYGGFLTLSYLSHAPEGLAGCYITGGLSGLSAKAEDVYARTYPRVAAKNARHYARYPQDVDRVGRIADVLSTENTILPDGDRLTVERFQLLGMDFGMAPGFENVHWVLDEAFCEDGGLSDSFLWEVMSRTSFATNPLFCALQEAIYGQNGQVSGWAAERARVEHPEFAVTARPLLFTGEMMFPWMFDQIAALRPFRDATMALAEMPLEDALYDTKRLAANEVPVAAAVYFNDMYVDAGLSLDTAERVGNLHPWVTSEYEHDGLRQSTHVLGNLFDMIKNHRV